MVVDRAFDQAVLVGEARGLGPVRHAELAVDVRQVELDGLLGDPELLADRLVRKASRDRRQDRGLAFGQPRGLAGLSPDSGSPIALYTVPSTAWRSADGKSIGLMLLTM